jgi:DNA-binding CsgD family transcriptional regulator
LDKVFRLTASEHRILMLMLDGLTAEELSQRLGSSLDTVRTHIRNIYGKLKVTSREGLFSRLRPTEYRSPARNSTSAPWLLKCLGNEFGKLRDLKRLVENGAVPAQDMPKLAFVRITAREDDRYISVNLPDRGRDLRSGHAGHRIIEDHDVRLGGTHHRKSRRAIFGFRGVVGEHVKQVLDRGPDILIIVDDQYHLKLRNPRSLPVRKHWLTRKRYFVQA